ncbi:MAG: hypothetical protein AN484_27205, partial [Aphanizomenon flos-aquae WA102]
MLLLLKLMVLLQVSDLVDSGLQGMFGDAVELVVALPEGKSVLFIAPCLLHNVALSCLHCFRPACQETSLTHFPETVPAVDVVAE